MGKLYHAQEDFVNLGLARQSQIDTKEEHHSRVGKGDEEGQISKVVASQNSPKLTEGDINNPMFAPNIPMETESEDKVSAIAFHASVLSFAEIGIGSFLHVFHIPFRGQLLSLNQIFILTQVSLASSKKRKECSPLIISAIAAGIKSLSPMGKKITPMLAIFMQGLLFNCGLFLLGNRLVGHILGAIFSSLWSFFQPLLLYYIIFGKGLFNAIAYVSHLTVLSENLLIWGIVIFVLIKVIAAICITFISVSIAPDRVMKYFKTIMHTPSKIASFKIDHSKYSRRKNAWMSFKDLFKPFFIFSICLSLAFYYFGINSENFLLFGGVRPLATGFISFFMIRELSSMDIFGKIKKIKWAPLQKGLSQVYNQINKRSSDGH
ncbi:MAG: hypothetical protein KR126chlam3_00675 [Chlamydiae bacterium]|nr:hypothetical protein [Chlamydiota bacterium]